jgi:hypothetical protein
MRLKSILKGTNAEVFKTLLLYYRPPPAWILDCTCGYKHFWDEMIGIYDTVTLDGKPPYKIIFTDIRPIGDYQVDYRFILDKFPDWEGKFDVVVYDPPYTELRLKVNGVKKWLKNDRYASDNFKDGISLSENHFKLFIKQAYRLTKRSGIVIAKLQDTVNWWHFKFYNCISPFRLEALYIHDLGQNWAENVEVKNAKKPIPIHAYWFILVK